jgi:hypothetical protein
MPIKHPIVRPMFILMVEKVAELIQGRAGLVSSRPTFGNSQRTATRLFPKIKQAGAAFQWKIESTRSLQEMKPGSAKKKFS